MTFLYPLVVVAIAVASLPAAAHADLVHETFVLSTSEGAVDGNETFYTSTKHGLTVDGVSFSAKLTVAASHEIQTYTQGFGVDGIDGLNLITSGEYLTFSMELLNITGGDVNFDGFTGIDYDLFDSGDEVYLSGDASVATTDDNQPVLQGPQDVVDLSSWMPTVFSSIASPGAENLNAHLISSVTARFSSGLAAVPEPSGFLFGGLVTMLCGAVGRRGKRA